MNVGQMYKPAVILAKVFALLTRCFDVSPAGCVLVRLCMLLEIHTHIPQGGATHKRAPGLRRHTMGAAGL